MTFLLMALAGSGFIYYKFTPSLLSQLQGNTTKGEKESAITTNKLGKTPLLPSVGATLNYQVLVTKKTGETILLPESNEVHSDDKVRFKTLTPFNGVVYLLYEDRPMSLAWINSVNGKAQQLGKVSNDVIPVNDPLTLGPVKDPTRVRLLLIFVPAGNDWSLKNASGQKTLKIKEPEESNALFAAFIKAEAKTHLLNDLVRNAVAVSYATMEQEQTRVTQIPLPVTQNRVIYQWVELRQLP
jgi:hypothetical protein